MIYARNKVTGEHIRVPYAIDGDETWSYVEADEDGWIEWRGGECPLPDDTRVKLRTRNGVEHRLPVHAGNQRWGHGGGQYDIIAYRPILDEKPEAPEWDGSGMPPVGAECECITSGGFYLPCKVVDHGHDYVVVHFMPNEHNYKVDWTRHGCRPIRSEEDRAVEAMVNEMRGTGYVYPLPMLHAVYRAIRDGKVPGVKLTGGNP